MTPNSIRAGFGNRAKVRKNRVRVRVRVRVRFVFCGLGFGFTEYIHAASVSIGCERELMLYLIWFHWMRCCDWSLCWTIFDILS